MSASAVGAGRFFPNLPRRAEPARPAAVVALPRHVEQTRGLGAFSIAATIEVGRSDSGNDMMLARRLLVSKRALFRLNSRKHASQVVLPCPGPPSARTPSAPFSSELIAQFCIAVAVVRKYRRSLSLHYHAHSAQRTSPEHEQRVVPRLTILQNALSRQQGSTLWSRNNSVLHVLLCVRKFTLPTSPWCALAGTLMGCARQLCKPEHSRLFVHMCMTRLLTVKYTLCAPRYAAIALSMRDGCRCVCMCIICER